VLLAALALMAEGLDLGLMLIVKMEMSIIDFVDTRTLRVSMIECQFILTIMMMVIIIR
jgi:hypothetical protein